MSTSEILPPQPEPQTSGAFSDDGKSGRVTTSLSFSGGTATGPGFSADYTLSVPAGNVYEISVSADDTATVSGGGISASSHWDASAKRIVPGAARSSYAEISDLSATETFSISYGNAGGPYVLNVSVISIRSMAVPPAVKPGDEDCVCTQNCDMGATPKNGSVDFTQPFGRTPFAGGFSSGKLVLKKQLPTPDLFTPAGLRYEHYLTRRVLSKNAETQSATISADGVWENVYENRVPAEENAWKSSQVRVNDDGSVVEKLADGAEISYDPSGNFASVKSPDGVVLSASQLGVEVIRDGNGALRQIWSLADGLLDIVSLDAEHYEIRWFKPDSISGKISGLYAATGDPVKVFSCGKANEEAAENLSETPVTCAFELVEKRGSAFSFSNRWVYDLDAKSWSFHRGNAYLNVRTWEKLPGGNYALSETSGGETTTEEVSVENGNQYVGRVVGGVSEYSATRVASGNGLGKIASETDRAGAKRNYEYDTHARVVRETLDRGYADLAEETLYTYADVPAGESADLRPRTIVHKIAGSIFKTETFSYDDDFANGKTEAHSVTANGTTLTSETRYYPANTGTVAAGRVKYEIRADGTATFYEYSATAIPASVNLSSNLGYTKTETEGAWENGAFALVPAKSTRIVRTFDTRGNETRTEKHVHTGEVFELVSWENKTYAPTHKVISTECSDGKTSSADYICTGAVWTIDENGVRTDNTFDAAKRLKTSTRRGARGDVVTTYTYDANGRVISETQVAGTLVKTLSRTYDAFGELASETDALGNTTTYLKSNDGLTETVTFPDGGTRITLRNAHGETLSVTGTAVVAQYFVYGFENGLKTTCVFTGTPNASRWEKTYVDAHGRTVKTARPGFGENVVLYTENTYAGTRLVSTASTGQPGVSYAHDALGNVVETTQSAGSAWRKTATQSIYEKDSDGVIWQKTTNVVSCSDAGVPAQTTVSKTQLSHLSLTLESKQVSIDVRGNATTTISSYNLNTKTRTQTTAFPQMTDAQTSVSVDGVVVSQSTPGGVSSSAVYDAFNRKISATDARGNVTTFAYDAGDRLVSQTQTLGEENVVTSFEYDAMSRQTKTTFADGSFVSSAYDLRGNKLAEFGNASYPVLFTFDELNQKIGMQTFRALAGTPEELANLTGGDATAWSYDAATGLLLSKTDAAGAYTNYTYTETGLLSSRTWARGIVTTYGYDAWNQLVSTTYSDTTPGVSQTYDALGRVVSVSDASGTRTNVYDADGNLASETLLGGGKTHLLTELYDAFGRSLGYTYAKDGSVQQTVGTSYDAASGRIATASFLHGGAAKTFSYNYLAGTPLLASLVCPSNLTIEHAYEAGRDLVAGITIRRGAGTNVVLRNYTYDTLARPLTRSTSRNGTTQNDTFGYNSRSELVSATLGNDNYSYAFDAIGNRATSSEAGTALAYATNNLNQYTSITPSSSSLQEEGDRAEGVVEALTYDADGNATLIQTSTGTWTIAYNAENRPIRFENAGTQTVVECGYDSQGRRFEKKVTVAGTTTLHHRYIYRGYLQIAALDLTRAAHPALWLVTWDPSQPTATRPLAIQKDGTWFTYGYDITKNVCEVFGPAGYIRTAYSYAPFGSVSASENGVVQNFQWSSEFYDSELDLVYYNYRHYSPALGRFLSRDPIAEQGGLNLYALGENKVLLGVDDIGLKFNSTLCRELLEKLQELTDKLRHELKKYNPVLDGRGGFPYAHGVTKPGGHYTEIKNLQKGVKNKLSKWSDVCKDDNNPPCSPPYPSWADELSNKYIPEPVYPQSPPLSIWDMIVIGAGLGAATALAGGQAGPQVLLPEEIVTVPVGAVIGGVVGAINYLW